MEEKLKSYIKDLTLIRKCYLKKAKSNDQNGNFETSSYYGAKAIMLKAVIADLKNIVEMEGEE